MLSTPVIHTFPFPWVEKFPFDPVIVYITSRRVIDAKERKREEGRKKMKEKNRSTSLSFSLSLEMHHRGFFPRRKREKKKNEIRNLPMILPFEDRRRKKEKEEER